MRLFKKGCKALYRPAKNHIGINYSPTTLRCVNCVVMHIPYARLASYKKKTRVNNSFRDVRQAYKRLPLTDISAVGGQRKAVRFLSLSFFLSPSLSFLPSPLGALFSLEGAMNGSFYELRAYLFRPSTRTSAGLFSFFSSSFHLAIHP
ncbi:hypothetical protein PUN28_005266 [Cardiocondyla obscurior]|uniref:Ribosomal protein S14 n=1 Tax=Cardiocondyla obscurior TaxID=286306 RepID=A0AAW2GGT6_9HYME